MTNPYKKLHDRAFWNRSVSKNFSISDLFPNPEQYVSKGDVIVSAGSCFASNIVTYLDDYGYHYLRTEKSHERFRDYPENLGYGSFSAAYGNIYTPRHLVQTLKRAQNDFAPVEKYWKEGEFYIDPFRPGLRFNARSEQEFMMLTQNHLAKTLEAFNEATVIIFTLGLTEAWISKIDGAVYPACPGTIRGTFDDSKYVFKNFTVNEIVQDLKDLIALIRENNPKVRFIITVSPVPLVATATNEHVLLANSRSKATLRTAADVVCSDLADCKYFPAYEVITGPQAPVDFFESDRRSVSKKGVETVMSILIPEISFSQDEVPSSATDDLSNQNLAKNNVSRGSRGPFRKFKQTFNINKSTLTAEMLQEKKNELSAAQKSFIVSKIDCDEIYQDSDHLGKGKYR